SADVLGNAPSHPHGEPDLRAKGPARGVYPERSEWARGADHRWRPSQDVPEQVAWFSTSSPKESLPMVMTRVKRRVDRYVRTVNQWRGVMDPAEVFRRGNESERNAFFELG